MATTTRNISDFLNNEYHNYAMSVIEERALPNVIDGLKPGARKIIHASLAGTTKDGKLYKLLALSGDAMRVSLYAHGDASLNSTIVGLCKSFQDNLNPLESDSQVGSLRDPNSAGAPRYLYVKHSKYMDLLYKTDYDLPMTYEKSISDDDIRIAKICEYAKKYKIGLVLTAFTKGDKQPQNSAFVINKSGNILMKYSKVHTCDFADEKDVESGKEFKVCNFEGIQLGIMICYDREYPESARILMLKGAEIILVPNDCGSMKPRIRALSTRAYENMLAVAMANPNGDNAGCSCAFSPICWDRNGKCVDNTVLLADDKTEGIFYAEFDMEAIREYRNREMLGNTFRKVEAYSQLLSKEIKEPFIRKWGYDFILQ